MKKQNYFSIDYSAEFQEEIFNRIIDSVEFQRLKGVSFLGFMAKNFDTRKDYSRFDHSLGVAFLAKNLAKKLDLNDDEATLLILASFLHDIGHMPFSHASEEVFSKISRMNHYRRTIDMVKGRTLLKTGNKHENVTSIIKDFNIQPEEIIDLYDGKSQFTFLNELWKSPINLDTVDAINRCAYSFKTEYIDPVDVIDSIQKDEKGNLFIGAKNIETLDKFWNLKDFIYTQFIYGKKNIILESMLNHALFTYFKGKKSNISKYNLFTDDKMIEYIKKKSKSREIFDKLEKNMLFFDLLFEVKEGKTNNKHFNDLISTLEKNISDAFEDERTLIEKREIRRFFINPDLNSFISSRIYVEDLKNRYKKNHVNTYFILFKDITNTNQLDDFKKVFNEKLLLFFKKTRDKLKINPAHLNEKVFIQKSLIDYIQDMNDKPAEKNKGLNSSIMDSKNLADANHHMILDLFEGIKELKKKGILTEDFLEQPV